MQNMENKIDSIYTPIELSYFDLYKYKYTIPKNEFFEVV